MKASLVWCWTMVISFNVTFAQATGEQEQVDFLYRDVMEYAETLKPGVVPNGIYPSLFAFKRDQRLLNYQVEVKSSVLLGDRWVNLSRVNITPKLKRTNKLVIWGFADGNAYYINGNTFNSATSNRYSRVLYKGTTYTVLCDVDTFVTGIGSQSLLIMDMRNGGVLPLDRPLVRQLLQVDAVLLKEFEDNKKRSVDLFRSVVALDRKYSAN